jgi:hypothetical protein
MGRSVLSVSGAGRFQPRRRHLLLGQITVLSGQRKSSSGGEVGAETLVDSVATTGEEAQGFLTIAPRLQPAEPRREGLP